MCYLAKCYFQIFGDFSGIFALLISSSILFCFEYILWMISALINLLRTVLKLRILLTLSSFPCALGKDVYSFFLNLFFVFVMGYSWLKMLWWFQVNSEGTQEKNAHASVVEKMWTDLPTSLRSSWLTVLSKLSLYLLLPICYISYWEEYRIL